MPGETILLGDTKPPHTPTPAKHSHIHIYSHTKALSIEQSKIKDQVCFWHRECLGPNLSSDPSSSFLWMLSRWWLKYLLSLPPMWETWVEVSGSNFIWPVLFLAIVHIWGVNQEMRVPSLSFSHFAFQISKKSLTNPLIRKVLEPKFFPLKTNITS